MLARRRQLLWTLLIGAGAPRALAGDPLVKESLIVDNDSSTTQFDIVLRPA